MNLSLLEKYQIIIVSIARYVSYNVPMYAGSWQRYT